MRAPAGFPHAEARRSNRVKYFWLEFNEDTKEWEEQTPWEFTLP